MRKNLALGLTLCGLASGMVACGEVAPNAQSTQETTQTTVALATTAWTDTTIWTTTDASTLVTTTVTLPSTSTGTSGSTKATTTTAPAATKPSLPKANADVAAYYNQVIADARSRNGRVKKSTSIVIAKPLNGDDDIHKLLKLDIAGLNVQSEVCRVLGEGSDSTEQNARDALYAAALRASDIQKSHASVNAKGNVELDVTLQNCTLPMRNGDFSIARMTTDFVDMDVVKKGVRDGEAKTPGLKINLSSIYYAYQNIQIHAEITPDGVLQTLRHGYNYDARVEGVEVKMAFLVVGHGAYASGVATGKQEYVFL